MIDAQAIPLNCGSFIGEDIPVYQFKKPFFGLDNFKLIAKPINRIISSATSGNLMINDLELIRVSGSTTVTDYQINIQPLIPGNYSTIIYSTDSGVILAPDQFGIASGLASGQATIIAISEDSGFSSEKLNVVASTGLSADIFSSYAAGSLSRHVTENIDSRILGESAEIAKPIYSIQNHTNNIYTRNVNCWISDVDATCISPWNSDDGINKAGVLISPRHIIFAAHYQINNGAQIKFVDNNNNVITRTMLNKLTHPEYFQGIGFYPDITIGLLDSDVPSTIKFAQILPSDWSDYIPSLSSIYRIPALVLDAEEKALISELYELNEFASFIQPSNNNQNRLDFFENIILGDSGNPAFLIIDGKLVIITVWTYGGSGRGTNIAYHKDVINTLMLNLGGGYTLTEVDLGDFVSFGQ